MKRFILLLLLGPLGLGTALAGHHEDSGHEKHGGKHPRMERMAEKLDLTEQQTEQFREVMQAQHGKMREVMESVRPRMEAIHKDTRARLAEILDDEQLEKYDAHAKKMKQLHEKRKERFENKDD